MTAWRKVQGDSDDTITVVLAGIEDLTSAIGVEAHVWRRDYAPVDLSASILDAEDRTILVELDGWLSSAPPAAYQFDVKVFFGDGTSLSWPTARPDIISVRSVGDEDGDALPSDTAPMLFANLILVLDSGHFYVGADVEAILAELPTKFAPIVVPASTVLVADVAGNYNGTTDEAVLAEIATNKRRLARALLARYDDQTRTQTVFASPTISVGAGNLVLSASAAATTIVGGIKIPFARISSTIIDTTNDPNFSQVGVPQGKGLVTNGDVTRGDLLTGGTAQSARWDRRVGFIYTGQKLGIFIRALTTTMTVQVWVNGQPIAAKMLSLAGLTVGGKHHLEIDFGSVGTRLVEYLIGSTSFELNGVTIEPTAAIRRAPLRETVAVLGDSTSGGALGVNGSDVWPAIVAPLFGMDNIKISIGGTGYSTLTGTSSYIDRVADVVAANPDILIISGGQNDQGQSLAQMQTLATTLFQTLQAALPNALVMVLGCHQVGEQNSQARKDVDDGIKAAAAACGLPFKSQLDPTNLYATATNWAISTAYLVGDVRRETTTYRNVLVCTTAHTSASSGLPDMTKWAVLSFMSGTGKTSTPTGRGFADVGIQSDAIHGTFVWHEAMSWFVADFMASVLRSISIA